MDSYLTFKKFYVDSPQYLLEFDTHHPWQTLQNNILVFLPKYACAMQGDSHVGTGLKQLSHKLIRFIPKFLIFFLVT